MVFYSWQFFLFLPATYVLYRLSPGRWRWLVLLAESLYFYSGFGEYHLLVALGLVIVCTYGTGRMLAVAEESRRRWILAAGIGLNLLILIVLKYLPFLSENINVVLKPFGFGGVPAAKALLSVGVSYYVFQAISYLWDISLGVVEAERHPGYFALYMSFFPKLLQGPLERAGDLLPQLKAPYRFDYSEFRSGMILFTWGMFQKLVVADRLALFVDGVYGNVRGNPGLALLLATYLYAVQLLYDFGGYTDMALGIARIFGINLTQNFNAPYAATSVAEFWRRWHISFSRWLLDYIFKPLSLSWRDWRTRGTAAALIVTFLVSGIWHGASWGFVIWGGLHGLYLSVDLFWKPVQKKLYRALGLERSRAQRVWQTLVTFNLVCLAWVFFRANSLADAWYVVAHVTTDLIRLPAEIAAHGTAVLGDCRTRLFQSLPVLTIVTVAAFCRDRISFDTLPAWSRWGIYYALVYVMLYFSVHNAKAQFLYFQF